MFAGHRSPRPSSPLPRRTFSLPQESKHVIRQRYIDTTRQIGKAGKHSNQTRWHCVIQMCWPADHAKPVFEATKRLDRIYDCDARPSIYPSEDQDASDEVCCARFFFNTARRDDRNARVKKYPERAPVTDWVLETWRGRGCEWGEEWRGWSHNVVDLRHRVYMVMVVVATVVGKWRIDE